MGRIWEIERVVWSRYGVIIIALLAVLVFCPAEAHAQQIPFPTITVGVKQAESPQEVSFALQVMILLTVLSLGPAILVMMTPFTRIVIVLGFLRQALATQQMPPTQVLIGMALFLTFFIMAPVITDINENAIQPYMNNQITQAEAFHNALQPLRSFMFSQVREADLILFSDLANLPPLEGPDDVPTYVLVPAYITSELKQAFTIGFLIYVPFLIIDMVVASTLMSMGMLMLPPIFISLPFKVVLFVLSDGWHLLMGSIARSFYR